MSSNKAKTNEKNNKFSVLSRVTDSDSYSDSDSDSDNNNDKLKKQYIPPNLDTKNKKNKENNKNENLKSSNIKKYIAPVNNSLESTKKFNGVKYLYDPNKFDKNELGNEIYFNSKWNLYIHKNENPSWKIKDYIFIEYYHSIGEFWRIFNNFHFLDKINNQVYIMRENIMPIWEDINNRGGGIYSLKIEFVDKNKRNLIGSELMTAICLMISNECFVKNNQCINGINYSIKNRSIMIKLWIKNYQENLNFIMDVPIDFLNVVNNVIKRIDINNVHLKYRDDFKVSTRWTQITPED
jgi:hypothetical protein